MLVFSSRKTKKGGGSVQQPLDYLDNEFGTPNAPAGKDLLVQHEGIARPMIGGGSVNQALAYIDTETTQPNAPAGENLLIEKGGIARPYIGGFFPSVMKGVVNSGAILGPLVAMEAKRMMNTPATRKRKGGGKKEDWNRNRNLARTTLMPYGKPSGPNVSRYAGLLRKDPEAAKAFLLDYAAKKMTKADRKTRKRRAPAASKNMPMPPTPPKEKGVAARHVFYNADGNVIAEEKVGPKKPQTLFLNNTGHVYSNKAKTIMPAMTMAPTTMPSMMMAPMTMAPMTEAPSARAQYLSDMATARQELSTYGVPTVSNVTKLVSMKRKGANTQPFIQNFTTRRAKKPNKKLSTIVEENIVTMPNATVGYEAIGTEGVKKRTRKVSNAWKTLYTQAKTNLASLGRTPKAHEIGSLAALRKKGSNNTAFLTQYAEKNE